MASASFNHVLQMEDTITNSNGTFYLRRIGKTVTCLFRPISTLFPKTLAGWDTYVLASALSIPAAYLPQNAAYTQFFPIIRQEQSTMSSIMFVADYNSGSPRLCLQNQATSSASTGIYMEQPYTWIVG